ncbi:MAG TPA: hydrolase [Vicinamibacteria bacterium]
MTNRHPNVLSADEAFLVVIDVQERFRSVQKDFARMLDGAVRLTRACRLLEIPVLVTEQYPKGLGRTVRELTESLGENEAFTKTCFSSCGSDEFSLKLRELGRRQALICGIETHVCVSQTVHDLLQSGFTAHVAVDAVESRHPLDREVALRRMERSGAILTTSEAAAFELLRDAANPKFKEVQALFR